jgi:DNA mismatch repair protein MutL
VNHRYVKNVMSIDSVVNVYKKYLMDHRYPIAVIDIQVDPYLVDVNVHPSKLEVKFSKENELRTLIEEGVGNALKQVDLIYEVKSAEPKKSFKPDLNQISLDFESQFKEVILEKEEPIQNVVKEVVQNYKINDEPFVNNTVPLIKESIKTEVKKVLKEKIYAKAQIHGSYLIGENEKGMYLIDQHAAQERINYEYYKEKYSNLDLSMQPLIVPLTFEYSMSEFITIEERKHLLENVGVFLEVFSETGYILRSLPVWMKNIDEEKFVEDMIHMIIQKNSLNVIELQEHAIATLSCKASLKANTYLSLLDMQTILDNY